jgi:hypothetical protein
MKANRRRFLSLMGVGTAAGPLAAKAAFDETIAKQAGINLFNGGFGIPSGGPPGINEGPSNGTYVPWEDRITKSSSYIKMFGVPEFVEQDIRQRSQWVGAFDPDIAVKRSWSMAAKIQEQRQRNYERSLSAMHDMSFKLKAKSALQKMLGFEWPW